ncbi:hypothetical protein AGMMS50256_24890 [Betaproteobacteria bacterium]|nr:hypothetical protein AGMMS50256_24890 [Betaproteobacteria bacterium]
MTTAFAIPYFLKGLVNQAEVIDAFEPDYCIDSGKRQNIPIYAVQGSRAAVCRLQGRIFLGPNYLVAANAGVDNSNRVAISLMKYA